MVDLTGRIDAGLDTFFNLQDWHMKKRKSDSLWKVALEDLFPDLLRFIFPDAHQVYDMARGFEFLEKELTELDPQPDEEKDSRFADKLIKVYHRDGDLFFTFISKAIAMIMSDESVVMRAIALCFKPYLKPEEALIYCNLGRTQLAKKCDEFGVYKNESGYFKRVELDRIMGGKLPLEIDERLISGKQMFRSRWRSSPKDLRWSRS